MGTGFKLQVGGRSNQIHNHHGDVVGSSKLQGFANQQLCHLFGWDARGQNAIHHVFWDHTAEAIAAEQPAISRQGIVQRDVDLRLTRDVSQYSHQNTAARVNQGFLGSDATKVNQLLNEGVIRGDLSNFTISRSINS